MSTPVSLTWLEAVQSFPQAKLELFRNRRPLAKFYASLKKIAGGLRLFYTFEFPIHFKFERKLAQGVT